MEDFRESGEINMSTIAAIATGQAAGGIGVVRISGEQAIDFADKIFTSISNKKLADLSGYHATLGTVYLDEKPVDQVVATVFRAPKSYTGEHVVEFSCHGGLYVTKQVLRAVFSAGAVPAESGEFTKRAFLNGKMDLTEAEAVMSLISAQGEQAKTAALQVLDGKLFEKITKISNDLKGLSASLAAWVDYPDEEIEDVTDAAMEAVLTKNCALLEALLSQFDNGKPVLNGVDTAIVGKPNVGKSTLMNLLTGHEKSIVTEIAGTTRDIVEETAVLDGIVLRLSDTAGIHDTEDTVEKIGVSRARKKIERATLVLAVFDASVPLSAEDKDLMALCKDKHAIAIVNKNDLENKLDAETLKTAFERIIFISAKEQIGISALSKAVGEVLGTVKFDASSETLLNERQFQCCKTALFALTEAKNALSYGMTRDAISVCLDDAIEALDDLTGKRATETVVDEIFSRFCVGK